MKNGVALEALSLAQIEFECIMNEARLSKSRLESLEVVMKLLVFAIGHEQRKASLIYELEQNLKVFDSLEITWAPHANISPGIKEMVDDLRKRAKFTAEAISEYMGADA
jgi:hypothetical protein